MGNQAQNQGPDGVKNSHAAGSGSSTGDPGNPRGPKPAQEIKDSQVSHQPTSGASPDDHIELTPQTGK
jgi:hypothetical protein